MKINIKQVLVYALLALTFISSNTALSGPYSDDLSKCLVKSTSNEDKNNLVKWIFTMMASHPDLKPLATVSDLQKNESNKAVAKIFENLLTASCKSEMQLAQKYEGQSAIQTAFEMLGKVSVGELFANEKVNTEMAGFVQFIPKEKLESIFISP